MAEATQNPNPPSREEEEKARRLQRLQNEKRKIDRETKRKIATYIPVEGAKGAVKEGVKGGVQGAQRAGKAGAAAGSVLGPFGAGIGGAIGGAGGAVAGTGWGATKGGAQGARRGFQRVEAEQSPKMRNWLMKKQREEDRGSRNPLNPFGALMPTVPKGIFGTRPGLPGGRLVGGDQRGGGGLPEIARALAIAAAKKIVFAVGVALLKIIGPPVLIGSVIIGIVMLVLLLIYALIDTFTLGFI